MSLVDDTCDNCGGRFDRLDCSCASAPMNSAPCTCAAGDEPDLAEATGYRDTVTGRLVDEPPPAAPENDVNALREAIDRGLRKCRVEDAPVPLIRDHDLHHVTHMVAAELAPLLADLSAARDFIDAARAERDRAQVLRQTAQRQANLALARAESAEAAHAALVAGVEALAGQWDKNAAADMDVESKTLRSVATYLRALLAGGDR